MHGHAKTNILVTTESWQIVLRNITFLRYYDQSIAFTVYLLHSTKPFQQQYITIDFALVVAFLRAQ